MDKNVNIYFKNDKIKNDTLNGSSFYEKYIILMNETLQIENRDLHSQIKELENKISESEEEIDKYDVSKRYTRGLLKNLVEMDKFRAIVANNNEKIANSLTNVVSEFKTKAKRHTRILEALMFVLLAVFWETKLFTHLQFGLVVCIVLINNAFTENMISNLLIPKFYDERDEILRVKESIKKITDSQDFLNDYIDNI